MVIKNGGIKNYDYGYTDSYSAVTDLLPVVRNV